MKAVAISTIEELKRVAQHINELATEVISENVFYESGMLLPAFELLRSEKVLIVMVWSSDEKSLVGVFPLEEKHGYHHLPIHYYSLWRHIHCFLCTPLIRVGCEQECLSTFFAWLSQQSQGRFVFRFEHIASEGPFYVQLKRFAEENNLEIEVLEQYERPVLKSNGDGEGYLRRAISSKHLKDIKKKSAKLAMIGAVQYRKFTKSDGLSEWIDSFLKLEESGWKGVEGTAMAHRGNEKHFFQKITENAANAETLMLFMMTLDNKPIAMRCGFKSGDGVFSFKIAYDEAYAQYSPGVLLEIEHLRQIQVQTDIHWVDSFAQPEHTMLKRLWIERRQITSIAMSLDNLMGKSLVSTVIKLKNIRSMITAEPSILLNNNAS